MPHDVRRFAMLLVGGLMCLVLPASAAEAQTRPHAFEIAAGTMYGLQDPERPVTRGWIVSSGFDLGRQLFVVEGAWHRDAYVLEHTRDFGEVFREKLQSRYWMLMGGVRGGERQGRVVPYYTSPGRWLRGPFQEGLRVAGVGRHRSGERRVRGYFDGVLVHPCLYVPYPEFDEERSAGFVIQPGMGVDVNVWRRFTLRRAADLPIAPSETAVECISLPGSAVLRCAATLREVRARW